MRNESIAAKMKMIMAAADFKQKDLAEKLNISEKAASAKLSRGISKINDLVAICDACEAEILIITKDGTKIFLNDNV